MTAPAIAVPAESILIIDFALEAERSRGLTAVEAVREGLGAFAREWMAAGEGHVALLEWEQA